MNDLKNNDKWLFKFMPFNLNAIRIFINNELWFGEPNILNDTFEVEFCLEQKLSHKFEEHFQFRLDKELKESIGEYKLKKLRPENFEKKLKASIRNNVGICSFSEKFDEDLMWSHYANSNKGIGIVFNKEKLFESLRAFVKEKAEYKEEIPRAYFKSDEEYGYLYFSENIFLRKSKSWKYEEEYRFLNIYRNFDDNKDYSRLHKFDSSVIEGVILGENFSEDDRKTLDNLLSSITKYKHIKYWKCFKDFSENKLNVKQIDNLSKEQSDFFKSFTK